MPKVRRITKSIPNIGSRSVTYEINDYSKGFNTFYSNDKFPFKNGESNMWRLAQDARINTLGEYGTRKGTDFYSAPAGETKDDEIVSTTGASDKAFNTVTRLAQVFTSTVTQRLSKIELNLKNSAAATGVVRVELWSSVDSKPGLLLASSSIASSAIAATYGYVTARFAEAPDITSSTNYFIVVYVQANGSGSFYWSGTTAETTGLISTDSGTTWSTTTYSMNFKEYYATSGAVKGLHRAYKSDGTKVTLFVHGTVLYSINEVTGALTSVKTGLNSLATYARFVTVNDIVYYVNGYDGLRKWDFTTESQVSATNYSTICVHKGLLFLVTTADPNRVIFSNFGVYETFTSTDFITVPAPNTGDPVTALIPLNGYLIIFTRNNKYILSGDDNATFSLDEAPDQKGTYTQETVDSDQNFVYYLSDDGVYRSNASEAQMLSTPIYEDVMNLPNKEKALVRTNKGRLYVWYTPTALTYNKECYVFSLNFGDSDGTVESLDTKSFVSCAVNGFRDDDKLIVASSRIGRVCWQDLSTNDYSDLGGDINFELRSHFITAASPSILKEVRFWQPRFKAQSGDYTIDIDYSYDLRTTWTRHLNPNVQGAGTTYGSGSTYGSGVVFGTSAETQSSIYIPGEYRRIAVRYKHYAARQPQTFLGHTFVMQMRRIK